MAESVASRAPAVLCWILLCSALHHLLPVAKAISITLPSSGTKCLSEELHSNVVVLADYFVVNAHGDGGHNGQAPQHFTTISAKVTSPYGNNLHHQENVTHGQFAFTTKEGGNYLACFWVDGNHHGGADVTVNLEWRTGIAAKDWDSVAKKEKIEGLELELVKLEGLVDSIHANLLYLKSREAEMREVSEKTNARVAWFSIMSLGICILAALWQTWHLQGFFQKKKLI